MLTLKNWHYLSVFLLLAALSACQALGGAGSQGSTKLLGVTAQPVEGQQSYTLRLDYDFDKSDRTAGISCTYPYGNGDLVTANIPTGHENFTTQTFELSMPGSYPVTCTDGIGNTTTTQLVMPGEASASENAASAPADSTPAAPGFPLPQPADYKTAALTLYFTRGKSSLSGFSLPQQCFPGVDYPLGASTFEISPSGKISGTCSQSYNDGALNLTGDLTGFWDAAKNTLQLTLKTKSVNKVESQDQKGTATNSTTFTYDGPANFTSPTQLIGSFNWQNDCTTTNPAAAACFNPQSGSSLTVTGDLPFMIVFNPPQ